MLGCQDFCGYYDWTFRHVERRFDRDAVHALWNDAVVKAQWHYAEAGSAKGLQGLYDTWVQTGQDEHCDWTFTLDESKNVLRWDMRQCPSKGHLIENDLYADEDYCDHCMGWIQPLLETMGAEVTAHQHNHCGQCWCEMRMADRPHESLAGCETDITADPRWSRGHTESWSHGVKLPVLPHVGPATDPVEVLRHWFADADRLTVLGRGPSAAEEWTTSQPKESVIVTDPTYATRDVFAGEPLAVLIGDQPAQLDAVAERFNATPAERRPLLMHTFLPGAPMLPFVDLGLPRPVPILPLLTREELYRHEPGGPYPTTGVFALLLAAALGKHATIAGIDLYRHPSGQMYTDPAAATPLWPDRHSEGCDTSHIRAALERLQIKATVHPWLQQLLQETR